MNQDKRNAALRALRDAIKGSSGGEAALKGPSGFSIRNAAADVFIEKFLPFFDERRLTVKLLRTIEFTSHPKAKKHLTSSDGMLTVFVRGRVKDWRWHSRTPGYPLAVGDLLAPRTVGHLYWLCWRLNITLPGV